MHDPATDGPTSSAERQARLDALLAPSPYTSRGAIRAEVFAALDDVFTAEGPEAGLVALQRVSDFYRVDNKSRTMVQTRFTRWYAMTPAERLPELALNGKRAVAIHELCRRGQDDAALTLATDLADHAAGTADWKLYAEVCAVALPIRARRFGTLAALTFLDAALEHIPKSAHEAHGILAREVARFALSVTVEWDAVDRLLEHLDQTPARVAGLATIVSDVRMTAGRRALQHNDLDAAYRYLEPIIRDGEGTLPANALLMWSDALAARGDLTSARNDYVWVLTRGKLATATERTLRGRLALALHASDDRESAFEHLALAYASLTVLDAAEPAPLALYSELLAERGDHTLASWAAERAALEAREQSRFNRLGLERAH